MAEEEVKTYNTAEKGFATRCSMHTHGTFSTPSYGGVGEPYRKDKEHDPRAQGLQFTTNKQRAGQTGANWNNNNGRRNDHKILFEGEPYVDPNTYERKAKMEAKKKNLTPEGFRFSGGSKKNSGLGPAGQYGSIGPRLLHEPHFEVHKRGEPRTKKEYDPLTKQVFTNPSKKGYGGSTPGTLFGPGPAKGEKPTIGKEYEHSPDPYDLARQFERAERKFKKELLADKKPYRTMGHSLDFFDGQEHVAAPKSLTEDPRMPDKPPPAEPAEPAGIAPFYPAAGPKSGAASPHVVGPLGTFQKFPEHIPDDHEEKMKLAAEARAAAKIEGPAWRPTYGHKTTPTKTVLFHEPGHEGV